MLDFRILPLGILRAQAPELTKYIGRTAFGDSLAQGKGPHLYFGVFFLARFSPGVPNAKFWKKWGFWTIFAQNCLFFSQGKFWAKKGPKCSCFALPWGGSSQWILGILGPEPWPGPGLARPRPMPGPGLGMSDFRTLPLGIFRAQAPKLTKYIGRTAFGDSLAQGKGPHLYFGFFFFWPGFPLESPRPIFGKNGVFGPFLPKITFFPSRGNFGRKKAQNAAVLLCPGAGEGPPNRFWDFFWGSRFQICTLGFDPPPPKLTYVNLGYVIKSSPGCSQEKISKKKIIFP